METRITLRLPAELHTAIVDAATIDRRSLNAQIVVLLERALASDNQLR